MMNIVLFESFMSTLRKLIKKMFVFALVILFINMELKLIIYIQVCWNYLHLILISKLGQTCGSWNVNFNPKLWVWPNSFDDCYSIRADKLRRFAYGNEHFFYVGQFVSCIILVVILIINFVNYIAFIFIISLIFKLYQFRFERF